MNDQEQNPEEEKVVGPIPEGFIPDADRYMIGSTESKNQKLLNIGGRLIMNLLSEQMRAEHIIAVAGIGKAKCIIIVDYTPEEIVQFMRNARKKMLQVSN